MALLESFLGRNGFMPHGYCITWRPDLLWSMVGADAVIAAAYFSIPLAIVSFLRKRPDSGVADAGLAWVPWLFSGFIFWCGLTHVMNVWTVWQPDYGAQALVKVATAGISIVTAIGLWPLVPRAAKIPSVSQLQAVIAQLEAEVQKRRSAEERLNELQRNQAATLASAQAALRESEGRLRFTLEAAQIGDWDLDFTTGEARRSLLHDRCFGYDRLQDKWGYETFLSHVHPEDRPDVVRRIEAGRAALKGWSGEYRVVWPDASVHWVRTHVTVQQKDGKATHMLGIISDITQQKHDEEARLNAQRLEAENRQILEANRIKSQFLANMSHELRTPLNAVIGFADLLQSGAVDGDADKRRVFLGHIGTSGRHLLRLINDLLDLSKVESGRFEFFPEPVDLPSLVRSVTDTLSPASQAKQIAVETQIDPALNDLVLDPARLKQVLYNYLSNAIKFTPDRGRVTVRARTEGTRRFRLEVEDNGIGIAPEDLPRLFTEFQQLDGSASKQHQGTGLGLALTRRLVEAQGGSVGVRSTPGVGSVFHLVLDRAPATQRAATSSKPVLAPAGDRSAS
jgi:PAS domain S-box-containing protein